MYRRCCGPCRERFPDHLLEPYSIPTDEGIWWCPICSTRRYNREEGLPLDTPPRTEIARKYWDEAMAIMERRKRLRRRRKRRA